MNYNCVKEEVFFLYFILCSCESLGSDLGVISTWHGEESSLQAGTGAIWRPSSESFPPGFVHFYLCKIEALITVSFQTFSAPNFGFKNNPAVLKKDTFNSLSFIYSALELWRLIEWFEMGFLFVLFFLVGRVLRRKLSKIWQPCVCSDRIVMCVAHRSHFR